jgi:hypothetical protein
MHRIAGKRSLRLAASLKLMRRALDGYLDLGRPPERVTQA